MAKLFGFSIDDNDDLPKGVVSPIPQTGEDGVDYYIQSGFSSQVIDLEGIYKDEHQSIKKVFPTKSSYFINSTGNFLLSTQDF